MICASLPLMQPPFSPVHAQRRWRPHCPALHSDSYINWLCTGCLAISLLGKSAAAASSASIRDDAERPGPSNSAPRQTGCVFKIEAHGGSPSGHAAHKDSCLVEGSPTLLQGGAPMAQCSRHRRGRAGRWWLSRSSHWVTMMRSPASRGRSRCSKNATTRTSCVTWCAPEIHHRLALPPAAGTCAPAVAEVFRKGVTTGCWCTSW